MLDIQIKGVDSIARNMARASEEGDRINHNRVGRLSGLIARRMKEYAPKKTGRLIKSIKTNAVARMVWTVMERGVIYGIFQRMGARGGIGGSGYIYPVNKRALYWVGLSHPIPFVGPPMTRKHPGIKANPYDLLAIEASRADIQKTADAIGATYVEIITRGGAE